MSELEEKQYESRGGLFPPIVMHAQLLDFGLSEKTGYELNLVVYKARLQFAKDCADAESKMLTTIQEFIKKKKI